jgi:hypothetical protein
MYVRICLFVCSCIYLFIYGDAAIENDLEKDGLNMWRRNRLDWLYDQMKNLLRSYIAPAISFLSIIINILNSPRQSDLVIGWKLLIE